MSISFFVKVRVLRVIALLCMLAGVAHGQGSDLIVSQRVGSIIEPDERRYFGLFESIPGFRSARFTPSSDSVVAVITGAEGRDTMLAMSRDGFRDLGIYIDRYEDLFLPGGGALNLQGIQRFIRPSKPFGERGDRLSITTYDNRELRGTLLLANDSAVVLSNDPLEYIRHRDPSKVTVILPAEISQIRNGGSILGIGFRDLDVPVEGNDTMYREEVVGKIRAKGFYYGSLPPEAAGLVRQRLDSIGTASLPRRSVVEIYEKVRPIGLHAFYGLGTTVAPPEGNYADVQRSGQARVRRDILVFPETWWALGVEYDLLRWVRVGAQYSSYAAPGVPREKMNDYDRLSGSQIEGGIKLVVPRRLLPSNLFQRFELYGGISVGTRWVTVQSELASSRTPIPNTIEYSGTFYQSEKVGTITKLLGLAYYPVAFLSIGLEGRMIDVQDITVNEQTRLKDNGIYGGIFVLDTHYQHTISQNATDLLITVRVSL